MDGPCTNSELVKQPRSAAKVKRMTPERSKEMKAHRDSKTGAGKSGHKETERVPGTEFRSAEGAQRPGRSQFLGAEPTAVRAVKGDTKNEARERP